jgi:4-hydroxythreonine-4-phosphate dehydrogenase
MGDPAGIGGEVILKAVDKISGRTVPVVIGDRPVLDALAARLPAGRHCAFKGFGQGEPGDMEMVDLGIVKHVQPGVTDAACGEASYRYIMEAVKLVTSGQVSAIVTCPITKKSIQSAGIPFIGHTELLAHFSGAMEHVMMMANSRMRVSLVTIHVPLRDVPALMTVENVFRCIVVTARALTGDFGVRAPYIKVCGLNPHAGEQGMMGNEEAAIVEAIERARRIGVNVGGPFPADSLFHRPGCDAYVAMYHDQGLIPVKTIDFARTVNITLGLPFIRTSVGHGTGLDIAGTGRADPTSLVEAYRTAERMIGMRSRVLHPS